MTSSSLVLVAGAGDGTISSYRLDADALVPSAVTAGVTGCSTFVVDEERDLVYAAVKPDAGHEFAGILTLSLDRKTGALAPQSRLDLPRGGMNYLALARDGSLLLGASYGGGYGFSAPVADGVVGEPLSIVEYPNLHSVLPSSDGQFAYFVSLGADLVAQYRIDAAGTLRALSPATAAAPGGSGPRHLQLNAAQDTVYVITEFSGEILRFARDTTEGTLQYVDATSVVDPSYGLGHSEFGANPRENHFIWGADLHPGADGAYLWGSERTESTLGAVAVAADGSLTAPTHFTVTEPQPRGFALSPDGAYLIAAGERSTTVSLYAVDGATLSLLQQVPTGAGANWVRVI